MTRLLKKIGCLSFVYDYFSKNVAIYHVSLLDIIQNICYHKKARERGRRIMVITRACQA